MTLETALTPQEFLRSIDASRNTLGRPRLKLVEVVQHVRALTDDAPYAVIGGLAQILWARKTHTDDLDVALAARDLPDRAHEANDVFQVYHLICDGSVVDWITFENEAFNAESIATGETIPELGGIRFIRPESCWSRTCCDRVPRERSRRSSF